VEEDERGASAANFIFQMRPPECIGLGHFMIDGWKVAYVRLIVVNGEGPHMRRACARHLRKECTCNRRSRGDGARDQSRSRSLRAASRAKKNSPLTAGHARVVDEDVIGRRSGRVRVKGRVVRGDRVDAIQRSRVSRGETSLPNEPGSNRWYERTRRRVGKRARALRNCSAPQA
jgi:hypothetical protein